MSKWMRRFSWLALSMWLGCGGAQMEASSAEVREGSGDGELSGSGDSNHASAEAEAPVATRTTAAAAKGASGPTTTASSMVGTAASSGAAPAASATPGSSGLPASGSGPSSAGGDDGASEEGAAAPPSDGDAADAESAGAGGAGASAPAADPSDESSEPMEAADPATKEPSDVEQVPASVLTAGAWDDNRNYDRFAKYREELKSQQLKGMLPSTDEEHDSAHDAFAQPAGPQEKLDVALVIDTTGSMGDEIRYLQSEFLALSAAIEEKYPNAEQRWSLVVYRDMGDEYVTRWFDFRDDAMDFRDKLAMQSAGGGGDFPEAPDAALEAMAQLAWRTSDKVARLAFWVADAPHHNERAADMLDAIRSARELGVHLYPVASSGVDELTEVTMRSAAQLTGGRYLFLTDDSGIGGAHKEPTIPCYFVTKLDNAILRMVDIEMTGVYAEPLEQDIIRTGGNPKDGSCELSSGEIVEAF